MPNYYIGSVEYVPGTYPRKRPGAAELADRCIREWEAARQRSRERFRKLRLPPSICFSRKIGVGALEVAELVAKRTGLRVVDREILEAIAASGRISEKTVDLFDEKYPGRVQDFLSMVLGEKSFVMSDYARNLFSSIYTIAGMSSVIFVGRGTHLLLPRDRVLAVRFVASDGSRIARLAAEFSLRELDAAEQVRDIDRQQEEFYRKVFDKGAADPTEFDLTINLDQIRPPIAALLVDTAFREKYAGELSLAARPEFPEQTVSP
ncbi:MAG: cytidylate kinase-like family protein [Deltaproteobacteria bacterium]|nr:cytidylate kinase-like family protein [Deltaproteobacteria bacterium]